MINRFRIAAVFACLAAVVVFVSALAKGGFDFITITGPNLREAVRISDAELTTDFFTFANFYEDKTTAPTDPGQGFEITRHYVDGKQEIIFDRLHYYPETGFVFYDGLENGESEYDGKWYLAKSEVKIAFQKALSRHSTQPTDASGSATSSLQTKPNAGLPQMITLAIISLGIISVLLLAARRASAR